VTEDTNTQVTGTLAVSDVDTGEAVFNTTPTVAASYGTFAINSAGAWSYELDNTNSTVNALAAGAALTDNITVASVDGTTKQIAINITGANDGASITGTTTGAVTEDSGAQVTGSLTVNDVDTGEAVFNTTPTVAASYGTFAINSAGAWTYDLDNTNSTVNALVAGAPLTDSITVASIDGTATQVITINITGANDAAVITGTATGAVTEDTNTQVTGTLAVSDVDTGEALFNTTPTVAALYGTFAINSAGAWTYDLDNTNSTVNALAAGAPLTDSITVASIDGTATQVITINITGANDAAIITGTATGAVTEDSGAQVTGSLTVNDVDTGEALFNTTPTVAALYGTFAIDSAGAWTYDLNNSDATVNALAAGAALTDSITIASVDGSATQVITINITGANDAASITGTSTATLSETDAVQSATGTLTASDPDSSNLFVVQNGVTGSNGYGSFSITDAGVWTYTMNNAHNEFVGGTNYTDSITVTTADGTPQLITVTITGSNDAAVISGLTTGSVNEAGGVANNVLGSPTAMGILTDTDVDNPANTFHAVAANTVSTGGYGTYQVSDTGIWTYTLNNNNTSVEALNAGNTLTDHITVTTVDGTAQVVSIIVNGVNDAAVIEGATIGSVTEDAVPNTTTGTLSVSDVDSAASFQAVAVATTSTQGYGSYTIDASGHWVYGLNNSNATVNALNTGGVLSDSFTVFSADGTAKVVNINIDGHTDAVALAPTDIQWNAVTPSNNLPNANAILASLSTVDPDTTSGFSYALLAGSSSGFSVTPAGNVSRASVMAQNQTYTLNIKTTDPTLLSYTETFTIKTGSNSDNTLTGTSGDDIFYGLNGEDTISGGTGNDILFGQTDDDVLIGGAGADVLNGGTGKDTASYHTATAGVTADLANRLNNTGDAAGDTYVSIENLMGSDFADKLTGNSSANQISGGNGNDTILGFAGEDFVNGGNGTDTIALTATSTDLNHANNGQITNVEAISASTAGSGVLIDLHNQSEGFTITGSAFADTIIASNGNDWITGGNGADIIDLGTHNGTDHVIFNTTSEFGDTICNFDTDRDSIDFSGVLKTLLNDGLNSGSIAWGTSASGNNSNTSVDLNNIEALYLAGTTNDGVASGSLTNANLVATEFNAEFNINVTNGENTLLVINDNTANSNKATVWMYTESGGAEIQASELQLIGVINANHSVTTNDFHLV
jgi:VCBS repeat-containing protein